MEIPIHHLVHQGIRTSLNTLIIKDHLSVEQVGHLYQNKNHLQGRIVLKIILVISVNVPTVNPQHPNCLLLVLQRQRVVGLKMKINVKVVMQVMDSIQPLNDVIGV